MKRAAATLVHVSISRGATYHEGNSATHHQAEKMAINDRAATVLRCVPFCGMAFQVRLRTRGELWRVRLRRFLSAIGVMVAGSMVAAGGGSTGVSYIIAVTSLTGAAATLAGLVLLCRMFVRSTRYIIMTTDGKKAPRANHYIKLRS